MPDQQKRVTPEMIQACSSVVAGYLQLHSLDSPSLCISIAEDVLQTGLNLLPVEKQKDA